MTKTPDAVASPFSRTMRDNIEGIAVAILMAIGLKYFLLEAYEIPTPSMQPALMGSKEAGIHDRILVNKAAYLLREPQRWDIAVFRYPHNQSQNYVKRIVGLPGEHLLIAGGDIYRVAKNGRDRTIVRKPPKLQAHVWKLFYEQGLDPQIKSTFHLGSSTGYWKIGEGNTVTAEDPGKGARTEFMPQGEPVTRYVHGYPRWLHPKIENIVPASSEVPVADLRCTVDVIPTATNRHAAIVLRERPAQGPERAYRLRIERTASGEGQAFLEYFARASDMKAGKPASKSSEAKSLSLPANSASALVFENYDDRLHASVGGVELGTVEYSALAEPTRMVSLSLEVRGNASFRDATLSRDLFYDDSPVRGVVFDVPDGYYWMLGDNTKRSEDGRQWNTMTIYYDDQMRVTKKGTPGARSLTGNSRYIYAHGNTNALDPDENPVVVPNRRKIVFTDTFGEEHVLEGSPRDLEAAGYEEHGDGTVRFVPRRFFIGRALATFWPANPFGWFRVGFIR